MNPARRTFNFLWKLIAAGLAYAIASFLAAPLLVLAGAHAPGMLPGTEAQKSMLISLAIGPLLALGVAPLAAGLAGKYRSRWLALGALVFVSLGMNTVIELEIFSTMLAHGGTTFLILMDLAGSVAFALVLARFFGPSAAVRPAKPQRGALSWAWRGALAVAAFPVIYLIFGMAIAPIVVPVYRAGVAGLTIPAMSVIMPVEVLRSALFLLAALPVIYLWTGSRRGLMLALGWALTVMVGLYGLAGAYFFPMVLRVTHSLEITADSFVYAWVLVMLLKRPAASTQAAEHVAGPIERADAA